MACAHFALLTGWLNHVLLNNWVGADWHLQLRLFQSDPGNDDALETTGGGYSFKLLDNTPTSPTPVPTFTYHYSDEYGAYIIGPQPGPSVPVEGGEIKWLATGTWSAASHLCITNQNGANTGRLFSTPSYYQGNPITVYLIAGQTLTLNYMTVMLSIK